MKVTKTQFIEAVRDNPDKTPKQVAISLGLTGSYAHKLQWKYRTEIRDIAIQYTQAIAFEQVKQLQKNGSKRYDTRASQILLEMAKAYVPGGDKTQQQVINVGVVVLPVRSQAGQPLEMSTNCSIQIDTAPAQQLPVKEAEKQVEVER